jgi:hypothetical protein
MALYDTEVHEGTSEMIEPKTPSNEALRLDALRRYQVLDTEAEACYDDLTKLAAFVCGTPIALVSLVDENRQWFKSRVGLDVSETPRNIAFCSHAILEDTPLVVPNALEDERFHDNPLVTQAPHIRFYAGCPLITAEGFRLGSFCVIDREPRQLDAGQLEALSTLSRQIIRLFELRESSKQLADALTNVKVLEGLLPICAHCKSIRDEKDDWQPLETYVTRHSAAKMTHGICPSCLKVHFPEIADRILSKAKTP